MFAEAAACVRFSINQDNALVLFGALWKRRVRGAKKTGLITPRPAWPCPDKWKQGESCNSYRNASDRV